MNFSEKHYCPACGFYLDFMPWENLLPSDEICPCCGIQFGYDDAAGGDINKRSLIYKEWKKRWINEGMLWKSKGMEQPESWDPIEQLKNLPQEN